MESTTSNGSDGHSVSSSSSPPNKGTSRASKWRVLNRKTSSNSLDVFKEVNGLGPFFSVSNDLGVSNNYKDESINDTASIKDSSVSFLEGNDDHIDDGSDEYTSSDEDQLSDVVHDSDYDTDLEINTHKWIYPEKYDNDSTGVSKYKRACDDEGIGPIRFFVKHIEDADLNLKFHGLNPAHLRALTAPLETNTTIESIDLEGNWIMAEGTFQLCKVLKENVFVTHLNLAENKIDSDGVRPVCSLLMDNKHIEHLNLSGNDIGDHAAESFFELLSTNSVLKSLNLRHNKFEDNSAHYFRDAMMENETLQCLDLSWNCFMSKGCIQLAQGLKENVGLKDCSLAMNGFGLEGGKKLGEALQSNRTLLRLDVSYCRLPKEASHDLAHGLHHNDILEYLDMSNNFIQDGGAFEILSAVDQNESSSLALLNLGTTIVHDDFKDLEEKLKDERDLRVIHGGVGYSFVKIKEYNPMDAFLRDPMTKLKEWVGDVGYRMIDLFRQFDKDNSQSMSHEEFKMGIRKSGIAITDKQMNILIERLDVDWDGEIDFKELLDGDKDHRKAKRDVQKMILDQERKAREEKKKIQGGQFAIVAEGATRKVIRKSIAY